MARTKQSIEELLKAKVASLENEISDKQTELEQARNILNNYIQNKETIETILSLQAAPEIGAPLATPGKRRRRRTKQEIEAERNK